MRILNRNNVPSIPVVWRAGKTAIEWRPANEPFHAWVKRVWDYCDGNKLERPSEDSLDELACRHFPSWVCGGSRYVAGPSTTRQNVKKGGCCGRRVIP